MTTRHLSWRDAIVVGLPLLALVLLAFWFTAHFMKPAPPNHIVMATGPVGGTYAMAARRYQAILARNGVTLELQPSAGSVDNLARLRNGTADVALVQGGIAVSPPSLDDDEPDDDAVVQSLGAMYFEPLWLFRRKSATPASTLIQLEHQSVAVGPEGSGSRALAESLLKVSGINRANVDLSPLTGAEGGAAVAAGNVAALFMVSGIAAPSIRELIHRPDIEPISLVHAPAFARLIHFASPVTIPRGVVDLRADLPSEDIETVAVTANLLVRGDLHPALMYLLLDAASDVHGGQTLLADAGYFPNPRRQDVPVAAEAQRFYKQGKPFLRRYLPFWLANLVDRALVLLIPIIGILLPAMRFLPDIYTYRIRSRITRAYAALRDVESRMTAAHEDAHVDAYLADLDAIERDINALPLPSWYSKEAYELRRAIDLIRDRLGHPEAKAAPELRRDS